MLVMGEEGKVDGAPRLTAEVSGTRELDRIEFYRNETPLHVEAIGAARATVEYVDNDAPPGEHIYWVRVTQPAEREGVRDMGDRRSPCGEEPYRWADRHVPSLLPKLRGDPRARKFCSSRTTSEVLN